MNWRRFLLCATACAILAAQAALAGGGHALPDTIRVGLSTGQSALTLNLPAGTMVQGPAGMIWGVQTAGSLVCKSSGGDIMVGETNCGRGPVRFSSESALLGWAKRQYRGSFIVLLVNGGLTLIDRVGLDDYLRGVVPSEVDPEWPAEMLKAQATACRTYTLWRLGTHSKDGFDLCAGTHCQVYYGATVENPRTDAAVAETAGWVITYEGELAQTYYHSASGGHTEDVEEVWPGAANLGYLHGVPDPAEDSPYESWDVEVDWAKAESIVDADYPGLGGLTNIAVRAKTESGRARLVELTGPRSSVTLDGEDFRSLFSLRSSLFNLQIQYGAVPVLGTEELAAAPFLHALSPVAEPIWADMARADWTLTPVRLSITGKGWGHGVGLSQWGAKALAELGYTWIMILKYYYQGVEVENWSSPPSPAD